MLSLHPSTHKVYILRKFTCFNRNTETCVSFCSLLHFMHSSLMRDISTFKQVLRTVAMATISSCRLSLGFPFSFSGKMKIHRSKLSKAAFYDFKARQNPQEPWDLCQMALCCILQAPLIFTISFSDPKNNESWRLILKIVFLSSYSWAKAHWSHYAEKGQLSPNLVFGVVH